MKVYNYSKYYGTEKIKKLDALTQTYKDIRLYKQLDDHEQMKIKIEKTNKKIFETNDMLLAEEHTVECYKEILYRTETD